MPPKFNLELPSIGDVAEGLGTALQKLLRGFKSLRHLQNSLVILVTYGQSISQSGYKIPDLWLQANSFQFASGRPT